MKEFTTLEIQRKYNEYAPQYDRRDLLRQLSRQHRLRQRLFQKATGQVLEVAIGTGANLPFYSRSCQITGIDLSRPMLDIARQHSELLGLRLTLLEMDATLLAFPDQSFDTVVSSLSLCTFPDPLDALAEMARVCRPEGRILLLEHGRSDRKLLRKWQDRLAAHHARRLGCQWNREPLDLVRQAGLQVISARRSFFGIFHEFEAKPA
ncbi:MAG TPA: methyltransferase domain-containing protein [Chloroflexia bacterium]|nr:methyltransferase domain-containing protein [Chloroflexia bacterium]